MAKLHQVMPKAFEDCFSGSEVTFGRVVIYCELLRTKAIYGTLHGCLVLKLEGALSNMEDVFQTEIYTKLPSTTLC